MHDGPRRDPHLASTQSHSDLARRVVWCVACGVSRDVGRVACRVWPCVVEQCVVEVCGGAVCGGAVCGGAVCGGAVFERERERGGVREGEGPACWRIP